MKIIYIGKSIDSINYFKNLLEKNEKYCLVGTFLNTDDYKSVLLEDTIDCVVFDISIEDCQDIHFVRSLLDINAYVVIFGDSDVDEFITYTLNSEIKYVDFLDNKSSVARVNAYFDSLCGNIVEFNVSEFFDCYINDQSIVFDDEELERFVSFLTCRRKKVLSIEEVVQVLYKDEKDDNKLKMLFHQLCFKFYSFLDQIGLKQMFNYNQTKCVYNYHLVNSDFYQYLEDNTIEFHDEYIKEMNLDFVNLISEDLKNKNIKSSLDIEAMHADNEMYVPIVSEQDDMYRVLEEEQEINEDEMFLAKAMRDDDRDSNY